MAVCVSAQSDYSSYLSKAMEKIEVGDCDGAERFYNVYKELTGKSVSSLEKQIADCKKEFHLGDVIDVNGEKYIVAHLMNNKLHGFAIKDIGVNNLALPHTLRYLREDKIPTLDEMRIIFKNNEKIGLTGRYWTSSVYQQDGYSYAFFYLMDFISGKEYYSRQDLSYGVLLIHRF